MPRERSKAPEWLPKGVIVRRGWYKFRPYLGRENGITVYGPEVPILKTTCTKAQFFAAFDALTNKENTRTLRWMLDHYHKSNTFKKLALTTRGHYDDYRRLLCAEPIHSPANPNLTLGDIPVEKLSKPKLQRYIDNATAPVAVNRRIQYLSGAWSWAERSYEQFPPNPCLGLKLNDETPKDRYVEDWEYAAAWLCACSMRNPMFAPAMELSYLCRARRGEVFQYKTTDFREDGLYLKRTKGSNAEITGWSRRLEDALAHCRAIYPDAPTPIRGAYILHDKRGLPYTKNALDSAWQRVMDKATTIGAELPEDLLEAARAAGARTQGNRAWLTDRFTFHDIKHKGCTDHESENAGQHKTKKAAAIYQQKPQIIKATR